MSDDRPKKPYHKSSASRTPSRPQRGRADQGARKPRFDKPRAGGPRPDRPRTDRPADDRPRRARNIPASVKARRAAADAVASVTREGIALETALARADGYLALEARDRAFARAVSAITFRRMGQIKAVLKPLIRKAPPEFVVAVMQTATAQILFLSTPAHAAVSETVEVLKSQDATKGFANLANAVLRKVAEQGPALAGAQPPKANIPGWIRGGWEKDYKRVSVNKMALMLTKDPVLDLNVGDDTQSWAERLEADIVGPQTVRLSRIGNVTELDGYGEGSWWAQDVAASLPAQILETLSGGLAGKSVLDLCAAPGGKTLQLARMGAQVTALDKSEHRLKRLAENLERTKLAADVICEDALEFSPEGQFDAVLLDAPCSATGTFRRHPDVLYNRTPKTVAQLVRLQDKLLAKAAALVKPGGWLIYAVCSLQPEEGAPRIAKFNEALPDFGLIPVPQTLGLSLPEERFAGGTLRTLPSDMAAQGGLDGFFIAAMQRKA